MNSKVDGALFLSFKRLYSDIDFFIDTFYVVFIASHPKIKTMFAEVSMNRQRDMLKHAIVHIIGPVGSDGSEIVIRRLGEMHRTKYNVTDEDKDEFVIAMVESIRKVDPTVSSETLKKWRLLIAERLQPF